MKITTLEKTEGEKFITPALLICYLCQFYIAAITKSYNSVFLSFIHLNNYLSIQWIMHVLKCMFFENT